MTCGQVGCFGYFFRFLYWEIFQLKVCLTNIRAYWLLCCVGQKMRSPDFPQKKRKNKCESGSPQSGLRHEKTANFVGCWIVLVFPFSSLRSFWIFFFSFAITSFLQTKHETTRRNGFLVDFVGKQHTKSARNTMSGSTLDRRETHWTCRQSEAWTGGHVGPSFAWTFGHVGYVS